MSDRWRGSSEPVRVGDIVPAAVARGAGSRQAPDPTWTAILTRWEEIVGPSLAAHAGPSSLRGGRLVVAVEQSAWATQLRTVGSRVLDRVEEVTGERPARLDVVVRPPARRGSGGSDGASG